MCCPMGGLPPCSITARCVSDDPVRKSWKQFAEGMHTPLGIMAISDREVLVCQRAELTRIRDTQRTGVADSYTPVTDQWGLSGNHHEFAYGPVRTPDGHLFIALGNASTGSVARYETRGKLIPPATPSAPIRCFRWCPIAAGSCGSSRTAGLTPCGLRLPPTGRHRRSTRKADCIVTDNQGDWVGTSKLHLSNAGGFYGHPSGLVWTPGFASHPHPTVLELDRRRHEGAVLFPHAILANSPGQPVFDLTRGIRTVCPARCLSPNSIFRACCGSCSTRGRRRTPRRGHDVL